MHHVVRLSPVLAFTLCLCIYVPFVVFFAFASVVLRSVLIVLSYSPPISLTCTLGYLVLLYMRV